MASSSAPFTEPIAISDTYTSGLGRIEDMGDGTMRFTFFVHQIPMNCDSGPERVVVSRIIMPISAVRDGTLATLAALKCPPACSAHWHLETDTLN